MPKNSAGVETVLEQEPAVAAKQFVVREVRVDSRNVVRKIVELTPSVCDVCGEDLVEANRRAGMVPWEDASEGERKMIERVVKEHKDKFHGSKRSNALTEDELPTKWLSKEDVP